MNGEKREKKSSGKGNKKDREKGTKKEITKHIAPHANGEPILKRSSSHSLLSSSITILLVWSANGNAPFQGKFQVNLPNDDTYRWNCATSSYGQIE